ncbi:MAG: hypothetical protein LBV72_02685 [Tannerella sp.]|jgi:hypothetical protein|nr:hypothetical protein [Tannerella sp.]
MDLSFLGFEIFKYWDILVQYINPLLILLWAIIGGLTGIVLAIILLLALRKQIFVTRRHWILKWLSYAYIIFLPLFIGFSFAQWSALHNCERQIIQNIPKYLGDTHMLYNTYLKAEVEKIVAEEILKQSGNELLEGAVNIAQSYVGTTLKSDSKDKLQAASYKDKISEYLVQTLLESSYVRELIVSEARNRIGKVLLMDKELTKDFFDTEIQKLLDNGVINTVLEKHVKHLFGGFKMNVLLILLLGVLIPAIEIFIACLLHRKKLRNQPPPIPVTQ